MSYLKKTRLLSLMLVLLCSTFSVFAQERVVTGKVTDQQTGKPLEGVTVKVKNTTAVTATDEQGNFKIKVPSTESIITFTSVGYGVYEIKAGTNSSLSIPLTQTANIMDDVVVVGYGTKKRTNAVNAVAVVKGEQIEDIAVANLGAALINQVPGVGVNFASGKPGSTTTITIRGASTFGGASLVGVTSDPLFVIDGIVVTKTDFDNLDASMVENISFLKDSEAAVYGAAGAKGVVLVTTKKGKPGKTRITYSGYFGTSTASVKPKVLSAYEHAKFLNDGFILNNSALTSRFSDADLTYLQTSPSKWWYDEIWKPGTLTRHTINISGGTEKVTFFAGGNYYDEGGNYGGISIKKYGIRAGMNAKVTNEVTASIIMSVDNTKDNRHTLKGANAETDDLMIRALFLTPKWVPLTIDGKPVNWSGPNPPGAWNPVALENSGNYSWNTSQGLGLNASLEYKPNFLKGLTAKFQYGKNNRNGFHKEYFPPYLVYNFVRTGQNSLLYSTTPSSSVTSKISNSDQLGQSTTTYSSYQYIGSLSYSKKFKKSDFDILLATDASANEGMEVFFYKNGQLINGIDEFWAFNNSSSVIRNPTYTNGVKRSYLGRLNYNLLNKYIVEVVARYDGSSNFAPSNRWGLFPSVGLGWKISEEKFFKDNIHFVSYMKVRGNIGIVGEDRVNARLWESRFTQTTGALLGSTPTNGLDPNIYPNPDITWEKARTLNVGFDATLFKNKINFTADFYHRYNYDGYDQLSASALPATFGASAAVVNYGKSISWGSEFSIGYKGKINREWSFNADVNFGFSNSMLLQTYYNETYLGTYGTNELGLLVGRDPKKYNSNNYGYIAKGILRTQAEVDALLAKNPNYKIGGVKPQVGFMDYEDINGDGQINDNDITTMFDRTATAVGFGITLGVSYKGFKLNTNIRLDIGGKKFYDSEARKVPTTTQNAPAFWSDHWTPENPNATYPRADAPLAKENSTLWAVNGTACRINNMVLSYAMPKSLSERLRIPELRILVTGTNLWNIINPFKYKDPYTSNFASYPTLRTISFGINAAL